MELTDERLSCGINRSSVTRKALASLINVRKIATERLRKYKRVVNLLTYEGTILDRLAFHFVNTTWNVDEYRVICSIRPCMHPDLIAEVTYFAAYHGYQLVGFQGDCSARRPWETSVPRSCENISKHIMEHLKGSHGLLISSALLNSETASGFTSINSMYSGLFKLESHELARYQDVSDGKNWATLFLFESLTPLDVVTSYSYFVSTDLQLYHIPLCYLDCYNEKEQLRIIELVKSSQQEILHRSAKELL